MNKKPYFYLKKNPSGINTQKPISNYRATTPFCVYNYLKPPNFGLTDPYFYKTLLIIFPPCKANSPDFQPYIYGISLLLPISVLDQFLFILDLPLRAILNKSWQQHPTRHQLYGHLPPIPKTIQVRRTRHAGYHWRSRDELIRDVLLWIPTHGRAKAGRPAQTYIQQLCEDTGCCPEDLTRAMNDREEWRERVRDIRATSTIWWWWWWCLYIYIYIYMCVCACVEKNW